MRQLKPSAAGHNVVVVGTQWGDEGKGKVVDWLTDHAQAVVRFQPRLLKFGFPSGGIPEFYPVVI